MASKKSKELNSTEDGFDDTRLEQAGQAVQELARINAEANENAIALAEQVGYTGSLNPEVLESGIAESQGRVAFELFSIGARLLLLKELCGHGEFADRCARVGYEGSVARRLMQATLKLGNRATSHDLERLGKSKLFELLVLDDDELDSFTNGGSARGIVMDDADRMSVKELRAALRESRENYDAQGEVIRKKDEKLNAQEKQLHKLQKRVETASPDDEAKQLREEVSLFAYEAETAILGKLTPGFEALAAHADANGCTHEEFMAGCLCQIERALIGLRNRFNVKALPDGDEMPAWLRPGAEEEAAAAVAKATSRAGKKAEA